MRGPILLGVSIAMLAGACAEMPDVPAAPVAAYASLAGGVVRRDLRFPCGETVSHAPPRRALGQPETA